MNPDNVLLNYMYQKGYTDEDMFDEQLMTNVENSFSYLFYKAEKAVVNVFNQVKEVFMKLWEKMKPLVIAFNENSKEKPETFINPSAVLKINHQVLDRKPRHMVRKIIR